MGFDGFVLRALVKEFQELTGSRIGKISQPTPTEVILHLRKQGENARLLLSASHAIPRVHLTEENPVNPSEPPVFCMVLRKHLESGIILAVRQAGMDRILWIDVQVRNELGDTTDKRLTLEVMGKHSNLILTDPESGQIIDSLHHISAAVSRYRQVLPGRTYMSPPEQHKLDPLAVDRETFLKVLDFNRGKLDHQLVEQFAGMSPLLAGEILFRAGLSTRENLWRAFWQVIETLARHAYEPTIVRGKKTDFHVIKLASLPGKAYTYPTVSQCISHFYQEKAHDELLRQQASDFIRWAQNEKKKNEKKLAKLQEELNAAGEAEGFRRAGELLTAHLHQVKPGSREIIVQDFYEEDLPEVRIPLDASKTPAENAQSYFKRYNKAKRSQAVTREQITLTQEEIDYLEGILTQLQSADLHDLEEIREELVEQGYLHPHGIRGKKGGKHRDSKQKKSPIQLFSLSSSEGIPLFVGKNNRQNDYLVTRFANKEDTWLHTKEAPGSHVLIRGINYGKTTLHEAALLAAWFSKSRQSSHVPVDYTKVKFVHKPSGARPGYVIYENQQTLYVTPDEELVQEILKRKG